MAWCKNSGPKKLIDDDFFICFIKVIPLHTYMNVSNYQLTFIAHFWLSHSWTDSPLARSLVIQIFMLMNKSTNQRTTTTTRLNVKQPTHILWCFLFGKCTYKLLLICWIHETKPIWRGLNFDMEQFHTIFLISCRFTTYLLLRMRRSFLFLYQSNKHNCFV